MNTTFWAIVYQSFLIVLAVLRWSGPLPANPDSLVAFQAKAQSLAFLEAGQRDSADYYFYRSLSFFSLQDNLVEALRLYAGFAKVLRNKSNNPQASLAVLRESYDGLWRVPATEAEGVRLAWNHANEGYGCKRLGNFSCARDAYEKAREVYLQFKKEDFAIAHYIYSELGNLYTRLGDYERALYYLERTYRARAKEKQYSKAAETLNDIGIIYQSLGRFNKAVNSCMKGLQLPKVEPLSQSMLQVNLGLAYLHQGKLQACRKYSNEAIRQLEQLKNGRQTRQAMLYKASALENLARSYEGSLQPAQALRYYKKSLQTLEEVYGTTQRREIAKVLVRIARVQLSLKWTGKAMQSLLSATNALLPNWLFGQNEALPSPDELYAENTFQAIFEAQANAFEQKYRQNGSLDDLEKALRCFELMDIVGQMLWSHYWFESDKRIQLHGTVQGLEKAMQLGFELYSKAPSKPLMRRLFALCERGKNRLLLESLLDPLKPANASLSDGLQHAVRQLADQMVLLEKQLFDLKGEKDDLRKDSVKALLFELKKEQILLRKELESAHPQFADWLFRDSTTDLSVLQQRLQSDECLLDYFLGDSSLFVFVIKPNSSQLHRLPFDGQIRTQITAMRAGIYGYQLSDQQSEALYNSTSKQYARAAHQLYQILIEPLKSDLSEKLIIIPDGVLGYLPFEALLTKPAGSPPLPFNELSYFIRQKTISYSYSANLLMRMEQYPFRRSSNRLLAVAPVFETEQQIVTSGARDDLGPLHFNIQEAESIVELMGGECLLGAKATKATFQAMASDYNILHLATHGKANDIRGDFAFLAFTNSGNDKMDYLLFNRELYQMNLPADMVVLSACETGIGELQKGEGIVSMTSGFVKAGVKSIITSLWSVNDQVSADLMRGFYKKLLEGNNKAEAIQQAKLFYLNPPNPALAHPYFWAGFVAIGDMEALQFKPKTSTFTWHWVGLAALLVFAFLFLRQLRQ